MTAPTKHICDRFHLNALTCSLSQPGNDHVLVTESEPAMTHSESLWKGFNVCVFVSFKTIQLHELHSSCGGLRLWWGERDFFFFFFFYIHLYPQTQRTEPILIRLCGLLSSPYWKSKYSHSDKEKTERAACMHDVRCNFPDYGAWKQSQTLG